MRLRERLAVAAVVGALACGMHASSARACGFWTLESPEEPKTTLRVLWDSVSIRQPEAKEPLRVALQRTENIARAATLANKESLSINDSVIRRGGSAIGSLEGNKLVIGKRAYIIDIVDVPPPERKESKRFVVTVKLDDTVVLSGYAMSLLSSCAERTPPYSRALEEEDIRNRVALALAAGSASE